MPKAKAKAEPPKPPTRKSQIDEVLLKFPHVTAKSIGGLDAYLLGNRMFACINGEGLGLRVPVAVARDLQFSRENVSAFQPAGLPASQEWIQINRADASEYEKDLEVIQASLDYVRSQSR